MKKNNPTYGWLFACVSLAVLLAISVYLGLSGWYFSTDFSQTYDLQLGATTEICVRANSSTCCSFAFSGGFLEGESLPQIINIKNEDESKTIFLRAKVQIFMSDNTMADMKLVCNSNWTQKDEYYYFNDSLISGEKVGLCSDIIIAEGSNLNGNKKYIASIIVEALDCSLDMQQIWGTNMNG